MHSNFAQFLIKHLFFIDHDVEVCCTTIFKFQSLILKNLQYWLPGRLSWRALNEQQNVPKYFTKISLFLHVPNLVEIYLIEFSENYVFYKYSFTKNSFQRILSAYPRVSETSFLILPFFDPNISCSEHKEKMVRAIAMIKILDTQDGLWFRISYDTH